MEEKEQQTNSWAVPASIILAGILIAGAVIYGGGVDDKNKEVIKEESPLNNINPVTKDDFVLGDRDASVMIVEYSDFECPFCKRFHFTMKDIMKEYGASGEVAWVFRQFPLDLLHKKARAEAEASECAGRIGGNNKFWAYTDRIFELTPSNDGLDLNTLPDIAEYVGLNRDEFIECLESDVTLPNIEEDVRNAKDTGGRGTPWSIVITKDGRKYPINGALPYSEVKKIIDLALKGE